MERPTHAMRNQKMPLTGYSHGRLSVPHQPTSASIGRLFASQHTATLAHEIRDHAVEAGALVAEALGASAQLAEVLRRAGPAIDPTDPSNVCHPMKSRATHHARSAKCGSGHASHRDELKSMHTPVYPPTSARTRASVSGAPQQCDPAELVNSCEGKKKVNSRWRWRNHRRS